MGLSSSQARLLNLTSRMHQIEYKAAKLEAEKLQMANESTRVYEDYLEALEKTKVQYKVLTTDGSTTYQDINSYDELLNSGFALDYKGTIYDGSKAFNYVFRPAPGVTVTFPTISKGEKITPTAEETATGGIYEGLTPGTEYYKFYTTLDNGSNVTAYSTTNPTTEGATINFIVPGAGVPSGGKVENYVGLDYAQLCKDAFGATTAPTNVSEVITNLINSGDVTIVQKRPDGTFALESDADFGIYETSISTNTNLQEVTDEINLKKAEAKYEADMKKIDRKDRKYDSDLAALDTERNAIKQEMETLKSVAKENVERTFKLFS